MLKLLNVARPLAFVVVVVVPLSTPVPEDNAIAIETPAVGTLLLVAFCSCTVTDGLIVSSWRCIRWLLGKDHFRCFYSC